MASVFKRMIIVAVFVAIQLYVLFGSNRICPTASVRAGTKLANVAPTAAAPLLTAAPAAAASRAAESALSRERESLQLERESLRRERDTLQRERESLRHERETLQHERDVAAALPSASPTPTPSPSSLPATLLSDPLIPLPATGVVATTSWTCGALPAVDLARVPGRRFPAVPPLAADERWRLPPVKIRGQVLTTTTFGAALTALALRPDVHLVLARKRHLVWRRVVVVPRAGLALAGDGSGPARPLAHDTRDFRACAHVCRADAGTASRDVLSRRLRRRGGLRERRGGEGRPRLF